MQFVTPKKNAKVNELIFYSTILILFLLSSINLYLFFSPIKVLGVSTESNLDKNYHTFWSAFLETHPEYVPGWIELENEDKVRKIDPNYIIP